MGFVCLRLVIGVSWPMCSLFVGVQSDSRFTGMCYVTCSPLVWLVCFVDTGSPLWIYVLSVVV